MSQCRPSGRRTGTFGNRATVRSFTSPCPTEPRITRPLVAPRSIAATAFTVHSKSLARYLWRRAVRMHTASRQRYRATGRQRPSSEEGRGHARVDGDVQAGGVAEVRAGEHGDRVRDRLGEHLALQDGALGVEPAELLLRDPVRLGPVRAPAGGE